jgi:hypothetical protein
MVLITKEEFEEIENIRKELCNSSYVRHSQQTQKLWKITHRKRGLKFILKTLFS